MAPRADGKCGVGYAAAARLNGEVSHITEPRHCSWSTFLRSSSDYIPNCRTAGSFLIHLCAWPADARLEPALAAWIGKMAGSATAATCRRRAPCSSLTSSRVRPEGTDLAPSTLLATRAYCGRCGRERRPQAREGRGDQGSRQPQQP